jgi:hypothetical protein
MVKKRQTIDLLPAQLRTEPLRKFFSATVDNLFQPADVEFLSGYVGSKPSWYDSSRDFYLAEPSKARQDYQFTPTIVSRDPKTGKLTNAMFYDDLVGQLRFQGALTDNHDRLFEQEYCSWSPPIDIDKLVNFTNYYWLPNGPDAIELFEQTDLLNDAVGKPSFVYQGDVLFTATGEVENIELRFTSGMKIIPRSDKTLSLNGKSFIVDGVGNGMVLTEMSPLSDPGWDLFAWDAGIWDGRPGFENKQYVTISRTSRDGNQWSVGNRWFHVQVIELSRAITSDRYELQSRRPIIEFDGNTRLWKYGHNSRGIVDLVDYQSADFFATVVGQSSFEIDGVPLRDGMRILVIGDTDPLVNARIYKIQGQSQGSISLDLDLMGSDDGSPQNGDRVLVTFGLFANKNIFYNGANWTDSGQQLSNQPPLFELYDTDGILMDDPGVYENSSFAGNQIFGYMQDPSFAMDAELGIPIRLDQFGDFVFENGLTTAKITYVLDGKTATYQGLLSAQINDTLINSWYPSKNTSRQYIVNEFAVTGQSKYVIDQSPADAVPNTLPSIFVTYFGDAGTEMLLVNGSDYTVSGKIVTITKILPIGGRLIIKSWNRVSIKNPTGYYEIPKNLSANPNNEEIGIISRSQFLEHFVQIMQHQTGFVGNQLGSNNYRDTAKDRGLGLSILQHRAPLLKLGIVNSIPFEDVYNSVSYTDPMAAMQYAQKSYQRFYNRFLQSLFNLAAKGYSSSGATACDPLVIRSWVTAALKQINLAKTASSPWAYSGPGDTVGGYCSSVSTNPTYVPASPARLGLAPVYHPMVYMDESFSPAQLTMQTHDGARIIMVDADGLSLGRFLHDQTNTILPEELTNPVAAAWLQFELDLYENIPQFYRDPEAVLVFDPRTYLPGKWRSSDYSHDEVLSLQRPNFYRWVVAGQIDYKANTSYQTNNPFTYNYQNVTDKQGMPVPGYWKGIYRWFYDTDRPHTHPWEMLGFSQEPTWWTDEYGDAPYTNGNTALWSDLSQGIIRRGSRQGVDPSWARPGLLECIPVDSQGHLLPPYQAGCVASLPDVYSSAGEWKFGDCGPIESAWVTSQDYSFTISQISYLMKPARFLEYTWDAPRTKNINTNTDGSQWIYINTNSRRSSIEFYVHRENPLALNTGVTIPNESELTYFGSCGLQHWLSEYLVSEGLSVTTYLGQPIRGADVQLAQRMAGYINSSSLKTMVDSFGDIGFNSQIIPAENVNTYLYRSTSIGESTYTGVIVERVKDGWRLYGYDTTSRVFNIIPSNISGSKTSVLVGNLRVLEYQLGTGTDEQVPYGTIMATPQLVYDFLISLGRYQKDQGWIFDQYDQDSNVVIDWTQSAKEFLFWCQGNWENGSFIALSPGAANLGYAQEFGNIQYISGINQGAYPVIDKRGGPIQPRNLMVNREDGSVTIKPANDQGIYGLRLYRTTLEHAIFFDNLTAFGDVMYLPLYDLKQSRAKIYTYKTNGWNGRITAPGNFLVKNQVTNTWTMTSNFDSTAQDIQKYFNIDPPKTYTEIDPVTGALIEKTTQQGSVDRQDLKNLSKHLIGYQERKYLQNLLLEDTTQFEFYQGFIRQKGTRNTIDRLLRNTSIIPINSTFDYYEEWMIRAGRYGATALNNVIEFRLPQSRFTANPQWIRLFSNNDTDYQGDDVMDIVANDPLVVTPPESYQDRLFANQKSVGMDSKHYLPSAGYVMLGETTWLVKDSSALYGLWASQQAGLIPMQVGDTVWQFIINTGSWMVWILDQAVSGIDVTIPSQVTGAPTVVATTSPHGLSSGDVVVIYGVSGAGIINGTYTVRNPTASTFQIDVSTFDGGTGGTILVYRPLRFATIFDRDSGEPPSGWKNDTLVYVDAGGNENGGWTVFRRLNDGWTEFRKDTPRINSSLLLKGEIFDSESGRLLSECNYFDPLQGIIPGRADAEISYKTDYDPAKYNKGNSSGFALSDNEAWGSAQIGQIWWDLSAVRYIDYGIGDDGYRLQHWGKIAPGTSIDIYEWVRSSIPPTDWAGYVAEGRSITDGSRSYIPSGTVQTPTNPSWSEIIEPGTGGTSRTFYYFWVKNSSMPSMAVGRQLTTLNISNLITDPGYDDRPWYAAMSERSILLGNIQSRLDGNKIIQRITYASSANEQNIYGEWELIREGDPLSPISTRVWGKLKDSLTTVDGLGNDVPDYHLPTVAKYGNETRPRQTWFINQQAAGKVFVDSFNLLISQNPTPMVDDSAMIGWRTYFESEEQIPSQNIDWEYRVESIVQRDALVGTLESGDRVLVDPILSTDGRWTIWQYSLSGSSSSWELIRMQAFKTDQYWSYVDWYLFGYDPTHTPSITVETLNDLDLIPLPVQGTIAKVLDNGNNKWQLYSYTDDQWKLIGQQDGNIQILPTIYQWTASSLAFDSAPFDSVRFDGVPITEFSNMIDGIRSTIYGGEDSLPLNLLLFGCINYAISEQTGIDWIIKTSNITLKGFNQPLLPTKLLQADKIDSILGYINETKPYHAKIREFVSGKSLIDPTSVSTLDFDRPPGSPYASTGTTLLDRILHDAYQSWEQNYLKNPELVRTMATTLIFDRISTPKFRRGWSKIWGTFGWNSALGQNFGAIDRIDQYYEPTEGMIPKVIEDLMGGMAYRGMRLSGLGFEQQAGWGRIWDDIVGWDPDADYVESYLDQIIQGGAIPHYESAIGTGSRKSFPLTRDTNSPYNMVVWSDGALRLYGPDWQVPTYVQSVEIIDGGSGYQVGDTLEPIGGSYLAAAKLRVVSVTHGAITQLEIIGNGSYSMVTKGPYGLQYAPYYAGFGNNALVAINWACNSIEFISAPPSSPIPNIFILYTGTTFGEAPEDEDSSIYEGNQFIQPFVDDDHPEELYPFRPRDSLIMDVFTRRAGGRPPVTTLVYECNGIDDQFSLVIAPQNDFAVMAYLDGVPLKAGLGNDFVVNYITKKMVFLTIPPAGSQLNITVIGSGGSSRLIQDVHVSDPGLGYLPGDVMQFASDIGQVAASCMVENVAASRTTVTAGGLGYVVNDIMVLEEADGVQVPDNPTILKITSVDSQGKILEVELVEKGRWTAIPSGTLQWNTRNAPTQSAAITITWGIDDVSVVSRGRYARLPTQPFSQLVAPASGGTGAKFLALFATSIETYYFVGDGISVDFQIPRPANFALDQLEINLDGLTITPQSIIPGGVRLPVPPPYGSTMVITVFETGEWSQAVDTVISIPPTGPATHTYVLNDAPSSTLPPYLATLVRKNGLLMTPPLMQQFLGNGGTTLWVLDLDLTGYSSIEVYQDQISRPGSITTNPTTTIPLPGDDWIINGSNLLIFRNSNPADSDIQVLVTKPTDEYSITNDEITFAAGTIAANDEIIVSTFSQDIDYEFHLERFVSSPDGRLRLTKGCYDTNTIKVWINGQLQTPLVDYTIELSPEISPAWSMGGWDSTPWDLGLSEAVAVKVESVPVSNAFVGYMTGLPETPPISWRTLTYEDSTKSIALSTNSFTTVLSNVRVDSVSIEIEDHRCLSMPLPGKPSHAYINGELIGFFEIQLAPIPSYPNRALLTGLQRNRQGTCGNPMDAYNTLFYSGDGSERYFPTQAAGQAISTSVFIDESVQKLGQDYTVVSNPVGKPAGEYVYVNIAPPLGHRNIKIVSLNFDSTGSAISHVVRSRVIDAGWQVELPMGYQWESAPRRLQYNKTSMARFLLDHHSDDG